MYLLNYYLECVFVQWYLEASLSFPPCIIDCLAQKSSSMWNSLAQNLDNRGFLVVYYNYVLNILRISSVIPGVTELTFWLPVAYPKKSFGGRGQAMKINTQRF